MKRADKSERSSDDDDAKDGGAGADAKKPMTSKMRLKGWRNAAAKSLSPKHHQKGVTSGDLYDGTHSPARKRPRASVALMKVYPNELEAQQEFDGFTEWLQTFELYRGKHSDVEFEDEGRCVGKFKVIRLSFVFTYYILEIH